MFVANTFTESSVEEQGDCDDKSSNLDAPLQTPLVHSDTGITSESHTSPEVEFV